MVWFANLGQVYAYGLWFGCSDIWCEFGTLAMDSMIQECMECASRAQSAINLCVRSVQTPPSLSSCDQVQVRWFTCMCAWPQMQAIQVTEQRAGNNCRGHLRSWYVRAIAQLSAQTRGKEPKIRWLSLTRLAAAIFAINCTSAQVSAHLDISLETVQMGFVAHLTPYDGLIATTSVQSLVSNLL